MSWRKRLVFGMLTVLLLVLAFEVGLRVIMAFMVGPRALVYGLGEYRSESRSYPSAVMQRIGYTPPSPQDSTGSYVKFLPNENKKDHDENGDVFHPTINRWGLRGEDFSVEKPEGVMRVITLGASSTFGYHNRDDETYPHLLEVELNEQAEPGTRYEVINFGLPHQNSSQLLDLFLREGIPLDPDFVTYYGGLNDCGEGVNTVIERRESSARRGGLVTLLNRVFTGIRERVLLANFADSVLYYASILTFTAEDVENQTEGKAEYYLKNLRAIHEQGRSRGIVFIASTQQAKSRIVERENIKGITYEDEAELVLEKLATEGGLARREVTFLVHADLQRRIRSWAAENEVPLADIVEALDQERDVLLSWVHVNARGNQVIAEEFAEKIRKNDGSREPKEISQALDQGARPSESLTREVSVRAYVMVRSRRDLRVLQG